MLIARHDFHLPVDRTPCPLNSLEANPTDDDSGLYVVSIRKTFLEMLSTFRHDMLPAERPKRVTNHPTPLQVLLHLTTRRTRIYNITVSHGYVPISML